MARRKRTLKSGVLAKRFPKGEMRETQLGQICPTARERFPFYFKLPYDDPIALLKWRIYVRKRCVADLAFRRHVWEMCRLDVAFFTVTFGTLFEPRPVPRKLPFHLWTDQVSLLAWFCEIYGERSGIVNKTRGIGCSWLVAIFTFHAWLFGDGAKIATLTKDRDLLDGSDPNSSIGKLQFLHDNLPAWAKFTASGSPILHRIEGKHTFINTANESVVHGFVSTSTKLRQLRFTMIFADEFAFWDRSDQKEWLVSAGGCTNCMLMVSTWNDFDDTFHYLMFEEQSSLLKMNAYWWNNHERWQGAYRIESGRVVFVDPDYKHDPDYEFGEPNIMDEGMLRSPWVDAELSKPGVDRLKALRDIYGMSVCQATNAFFSADVRRAIEDTICEPQMQGILDTSNRQLQIIPSHKSNIRLWRGVPAEDRGPYVIGCDLAQGVGANYSVATALDSSGEQVLEYADRDVDITSFAFNVVQIARWLAGDEGDGWVLIDFEANGQQAKPFSAELVRLTYGRIHMSNRKSLNPNVKNETYQYYGTRNKDAGLANFRELERAILAMDTRVYSQSIAEDMRMCSKDEDGCPKFPTGRAQGHGDYIHSLAIAWWRARASSKPSNLVQSREEAESHKKANPWEREGSLWSETWKKAA